MAERFLAGLLLVLFWPSLASIALLIQLIAGKPIIVTDEWLTPDGTKLRAHRFRTTGPGLPIFHSFGRLLRQHSFDDLPAFWNIARAELRLRDLLRR